METEKLNILLVDDQPGKLLSYKVILDELKENLLSANSGTEALDILLRNDVAVLLVDVCMPDLDGFEFARMVREHPRFQKTAIIFISAIQISEVDSLRGYEMGAVDYVSVPVVPELLRAKVRVFVDLYRKSRQLEQLNAELEARVAQRTLELEQATRRQELLAREVDHRAKNALAVVQSIIRLTRADDVNAFSKAVHGRIRAMAGAHNLLSASRWAGASLARLVEEELSPYQQGGRREAAGPPVTLRPSAAQAAAMALHELATNAAKYGAFSQTGGVVTVFWRVEEQNLVIEWREHGGPRVSAPSATGFGAKVIGATIGEQLNGAVHFRWEPDGLCCTLSIPNTRELEYWAQEDGPLEAEPILPQRRHFTALENARIMVVEDEALIALMIGNILEDEGAQVVGPFNKLQDAIACESPFDAALLDVNLAGVATYPLARQLRERGCPFIFATGYDEGGVEREFAGVPVLQKPIEPALLAQTLAEAITQRGRPLEAVRAASMH